MAAEWRPGDSVPDRWLLALEAGTATIDETCDALAEYDWPDSTPSLSAGDGVDSANPYPPDGWIMTVDAAHTDGRITDEQYEAIFWACRRR